MAQKGIWIVNVTFTAILLHTLHASGSYTVDNKRHQEEIMRDIHWCIAASEGGKDLRGAAGTLL